MPEPPKKPEQSTKDQQSTEDPSPEKISNLPDKPVSDRDAQSVKGGADWHIQK